MTEQIAKAKAKATQIACSVNKRTIRTFVVVLFWPWFVGRVDAWTQADTIGWLADTFGVSEIQVTSIATGLIAAGLYWASQNVGWVDRLLHFGLSVAGEDEDDSA